MYSHDAKQKLLQGPMKVRSVISIKTMSTAIVLYVYVIYLKIF